MSGCVGAVRGVPLQIWAQSALHSRLATGDRKTECNRDIVNEVLERVTVLDRGEKGWTMSRHVKRLTVGNFLNMEQVKEGMDVLGGVVRNSTAQSVRQDLVAMSVLDGLHAWNIVIAEILLFHIVVLVVLDLPVSVFVKPGKSNKVN